MALAGTSEHESDGNFSEVLTRDGLPWSHKQAVAYRLLGFPEGGTIGYNEWRFFMRPCTRAMYTWRVIYTKRRGKSGLSMIH